MVKKYLVVCFFIVASQPFFAQDINLRKGTIIDSVPISETSKESFSLFLPTKFEANKNWPILFLFDMYGQNRRTMSMFLQAAENRGFILASPTQVHDSVSLSNNVLIAQRTIEKATGLLPVNSSRIYTGGHQGGGRFANLLPILIKNIEGVLSINASLANTELLTGKVRFQHVVLVDPSNYTYPDVFQDAKILNKLRIPNFILDFKGSGGWPEHADLEKALWYFDLAAVKKQSVQIDKTEIEAQYKAEMDLVRSLKDSGNYLMAEQETMAMIKAYRLLVDTDSLREHQKLLKKERGYRSAKRNENAAFFKESLLREDYVYYLEEDLLTYNFNNLGWWSYQMQQIKGFKKGDTQAERRMGERLDGFVNALVDDNIDVVKSDKSVNEEALVLLLMLKTITEPGEMDHYLKVVSLAAKNEDYGTALFYLEEALKNGFTDAEKLYRLEHTALFRITPEFNALVTKYLKDARYNLKDE